MNWSAVPSTNSFGGELSAWFPLSVLETRFGAPSTAGLTRLLEELSAWLVLLLCGCCRLLLLLQREFQLVWLPRNMRLMRPASRKIQAGRFNHHSSSRRRDETWALAQSDGQKPVTLSGKQATLTSGFLTLIVLCLICKSAFERADGMLTLLSSVIVTGLACSECSLNPFEHVCHSSKQGICMINQYPSRDHLTESETPSFQNTVLERSCKSSFTGTWQGPHHIRYQVYGDAVCAH